jgi:Flp pilus assembly protein TadD
MDHSPRWAVWFLGLSFSILFAIPSIAGEPTWVEVRSEHFTVITDAGEKNARHVADRFEQMRTIFGLLFGRQKINQPVPLEIIAFRSTKEIRQYSPIFRGKIVEVAGFFQQGEDQDFIAVDMSREDSWKTVFHEYAHVLLNSNYQNTAPWFDEGFAEFFSSMKVTSGDVELGQSIPDADFLLQGNRFHLLDLFKVEHHSETYNVSGEHREMFYVQSWLVVHYLFDMGRMPQAAKYFRLTIDQKVPVAEAVQSAFGVPPAELEKTILNYLRAGKLVILHYAGKDKIALTYNATARVLNPLEVRAQLADLHLHSEDYVGLAVKEFEEILKANPDQAEAQRGLGYAYLRNRDLAKAGEHFQAAARLGLKDARVYFYSAVLMQQSDPGAMRSAALLEDLHRAIELDPQYADAYSLLGVSLMSSGQYPEAEQNLRHAMELSPRNEVYCLNYAMALMTEQKVAEAKSLLTTVANSLNPQAAQRASEMLRRIGEYEVMATTPRSAAEGARASYVAPDKSTRSEPSPSPIKEPPVVKYLKGTLLAVDCSSPPSAVLTVVSAGQTWKMKVANIEHAVVIGADKFSCSWKKQKVAFNYLPTAATEGNAITVEIQ